MVNRTVDAVMAVLPLWLTGAYLAVAPNFDLIADTTAYDEKRLLQIGLLLANALWLLTSPHARRTWLETWRRLPRTARTALPAVVIAGVVSSGLGAHPRAGLLEVSHYVLLALLAISIASVVRESPAAASRTLLVFIVTGVTVYVTTFAGNLAGVMAATGSPPSPKDAFPGFLNFRFVGQWQTWTLPLVVALPSLAEPRSGHRATTLRTVVALVAAAWWALLFAAGTRGTLLAQLVATLVVAIALGTGSRAWLDRHLRAAWQGLAIYLACWVAVARDLTAFAQAFVHAASSSDSGRLGLWKEAGAMVMEHPLLGAGPQSFVYRPGVISAHPHNALIQWASEWGLPAAVVAGGLLGWGLGCWLSRCRAEPRAAAASSGPVLAAALTASLVAAAAHAMTSGIVVMPLSQTSMVVVVGWASGIYHHRRDTVLAYRPRAVPLLTGTVLTFAAVFILCVLPETMGPRAADGGGSSRTSHIWGSVSEARARSSDERFRPRFWQRGELVAPAILSPFRAASAHAKPEAEPAAGTDARQ
jgi:putative inorganic carbon (HCO3(-)) transporter